MAKELELIQAQLKTIASGLPLDPGLRFDDDWQSIPADWKIVGVPQMYKVMLIHAELRVFAKIFAPAAKEYAQAAGAVISQLAKLDLPIMILPALAVAEQWHIYPLGTPIQDKIRYTEVYKPEHILALEKIIVQAGLQPLYSVDKVSNYQFVDRVEIDGQVYAIDPVNDSHYVIELFQESIEQTNKRPAVEKS